MMLLNKKQYHTTYFNTKINNLLKLKINILNAYGLQILPSREMMNFNSNDDSYHFLKFENLSSLIKNRGDGK